ncbi:Uncharacterized protein FKW44_017888, partial [Caligus rogercresseyi]
METYNKPWGGPLSNDTGLFESAAAGEDDPFERSILVIPAEMKVQNLSVLGVVFGLSLLGNLAALPVILFKRTKFGNGLFAVLILCLTASDVA